MIYQTAPVVVVRRAPGAYVGGVWTLPPDPPGAIVPMGLQPPGKGDYARLEAMPGGNRVREMLVGYTAPEYALRPAGEDAAQGFPGDLVWHALAYWLVIGVVVRNQFPQTAHARHLLARMIEPDSGVPPAPPVLEVAP